MPACYRAFDVFVTASWREGFPRSVMEASAMGLPIVASHVRGNRQAVVDGRTGLLFPVHDRDRLAAHLRQLTAHPSRRMRLGVAARALAAEEFDQERVIERTLDAYRTTPPRRHRWTRSRAPAAARAQASRSAGSEPIV